MVSRPVSAFIAGVTATFALTVAPSASARTEQIVAGPTEVSGDVQAFYKQARGPDWFRDNGRPATELASILRRAPLDGFASGPSLAARVEQAAQAAASGKAADRSSAERVLSSVPPRRHRWSST